MTSLTTDATFLDQLHARAAHCRFDRLPAAVVTQAKLCILDTIGCIVAGMQAEESRLVAGPSATSAQAGDQASVFVHGSKMPIAAAVVANGYAGDILELNDLIGGHASIGCVTAAVATAEAVGASGRQLIEAVVRAIELTSAVYTAVYPSLKPYSEVGLTPVGLPSSVGAAAGVAHLRGLDDDQTRHALAISGALAGWCPAEVIFRQGGTVKPMLFGAQPAATAVTAVQYASRGMTGPLQLLDGDLGYFSTVSESGRQNTSVSLENWALLAPRRKLHACCGYIHSAVDALAALRRGWQGDLAECDIEVRLPAYVHEAVAKTEPPCTANEARFDIRYCLALAACGFDVIRPGHSLDLRQYLDRPDVRAVMRSIVAVADPSLNHYERSQVSIRHRHSDRSQSLYQEAPRGAPSNPLSASDVVEKFVALVSWHISPDSAHAYARRVLALEEFPDCGWLVASLQTDQHVACA
ncbi:MmgE/PrpD family protein [Cupriavidus necator]|uniref:MmgE/PrpD family protein n=1 Tax=Cupriavidus necator TaxID=106590 RepID=UPI0005B33E8F|nr:MmgE/PrpD family protein [Cupriavidus necator]